MRIVVDCRYTRIGRHDGISRFTAGLVTALAERHPVTMLINDRRQLEMLPSLDWAMASAPTNWREPFVAFQVNRLRPDVVFTPMQTMGTLGRRYGLVSTLHDLIYYSNPTPPRDLPWPVRLLWRLYHLAWWPQRLLLNRADEVVTVSETTRSLMLRHRLTRRPITVVGNAADPRPAVERTMPGERDLLYMGSFMPYKNVELLARALHELPGHRLHLLSRISTPDRARLVAAAPADSLVFHEGVSDEEYHRLLGSAFALVHASHDEGFGIPLVEAMSHGTPVVVSDIPIFAEITDGAGVLFDPDDAHDAARAIRSIGDEGEWSRRSVAGQTRARHYDWSRSAEALLEVLTRVAASRASRSRQTVA